MHLWTFISLKINYIHSIKNQIRKHTFLQSCGAGKTEMICSLGYLGYDKMRQNNIHIITAVRNTLSMGLCWTSSESGSLPASIVNYISAGAAIVDKKLWELGTSSNFSLSLSGSQAETCDSRIGLQIPIAMNGRSTSRMHFKKKLYEHFFII